MNGVTLPRRLVALTPGTARDLTDVRALVRAVGVALEAGLPAVLLREPQLCDRDLLILARETCALGSRFEERWIGVHDSVHVALAAGAQGVHLGFRSLPPRAARPLVEGRLALGFSAHAHDEPGSWADADYVTFGPVRPTPSKEGILEATGFERLAEAVSAAPCPLLALGGMRPEDAAEARAAGARGLAVLSGILGSSDPGGRTEEYLEAIVRAEEEK